MLQLIMAFSIWASVASATCSTSALATHGVEIAPVFSSGRVQGQAADDRVEEAARQAFEVTWSKVLGDGSAWYRLQSVSCSDYEETCIAALARHEFGDTAVTNIVLWRLSDSGKLVCTAEFDASSIDPTVKPEDGAPANVETELLPDGNALLVLSVSAGNPWRVVVDASGKVLEKRKLVAGKEQGDFRRMCPLPGGRTALLGRIDRVPAVIALDGSGHATWTQKYAPGDRDVVLVDAVGSTNGELWVAEVRSVAEGGQWSLGDARLRRFDAKGLVMEVRPLPKPVMQFEADPLGERLASMHPTEAGLAIEIRSWNDPTGPVLKRVDLPIAWDLGVNSNAVWHTRGLVVAGTIDGMPALATASASFDSVRTYTERTHGPASVYFARPRRDGAYLLTATIYAPTPEGHRSRVLCEALKERP